MAIFDPQTEYNINFRSIPVREFFDYAEEFVVRPPYQRKTVWSRKKQQDLLDSLFRRYYVPRIVIREVRLDENRTVQEVIDGQQRITTAQLFLSDNLPLPSSLKDLHPSLPRARYSELPSDMRRFVDRLVYDADIVKGIDDPWNPTHQQIATEIFWRLQQGESLTFMEIAHARLSSLCRNFITKYADDISFDYETYLPIEGNPHKHPFFSVIERSNDRMQHLALLARLLIIEENDGPANIRDVHVMEYIDQYQRPDGIGNLSFEDMQHARNALRNMNTFYEIFKDDPMLQNGNGGMKELTIEYFIISVYLLLRHLVKYYVFDTTERELFRQFVVDFHRRWRARSEDDTDILVFSDHRQQSAAEIEVRHRIMRQIFFEYVADRKHVMLTKDERRAFSEAERIAIYRRQNGLCQMCLAEGKPERECVVPWSEYDADHITPHSKGGQTVIENAQVLCRYHNQRKGASRSA